MKIMKKIAAVTIAAAALFAFAGCAGESEDENGMLSVSGKKCSIDYTNEKPENYSRAFETLKTKHFDAVCKIESTVNLAKKDAKDDTNNRADGVMGYIFDVLKNDDGSYNFTIAGVRYNAYAQAVQAYVTAYKNVGGGEYLSAGNDFCDKNGVEIGKEGCLASSEEFLVKTNSGIKDLASKAIAKGEKATIWIDLVCQDGNSTGRTGTEGDYVVTFYSQDPQRTTSAAGKDTTYKAENLDTIKLTSVTIPVTSTNYASIKDKAAQTYLGFYANVYGGKTLTGTWELLDLEGAAEPVELE
ncbi:MAG: hypothetical protein MR876_02025 [Treponema porcinum]|uniref:hypothetical protein n=1 Tax=Treponema porcinum TaxID=261392 RepID=UPI002357B5BA|nr:hypothetical protein [Treponema porcinum]MCI6815332.1 hypothetical protein [Treponema porcinum]